MSPPTGKALGFLGAETIERRFEELYGTLVDFGYKKLECELRPGLPFTFEFAIAELDLEEFGRKAISGLYRGINYSPTFDDSLGDMRIRASELSGRGVGGFLEGCYAHPIETNYADPNPPFTAVLSHIVTPAPVFLDAGKTRVSIPTDRQDALGEHIGKAMYGVLKPYHKAGKKRIKQQTKVDKPKPKPKEMTLKDACYKVIPQAKEHVSGNGALPYSARRLLYRVRKMIQQYTSAELTEGYFRDNILQQYQRDHGKLDGLYYESRGRLHEPHGGGEMDVGTREVEAYEFPKHRYNKLLYVEKRGQWPLLRDARLRERFDMAIMTGQGVATTAARTLLANAEADQAMQIFVLHDADPYGYNIAHTLREATERMPGHKVEVIDLGLTIEQGLELDIEPEDFSRKEALYWRVLKHLDPESPAWELFGADEPNKKNVKCKRIELDALSSQQAIDLIERGLRAEGVFGKVVPGPDDLPNLADEIYRTEADKWAEAALEDLLGWKDLKRRVADEFKERYKLENSERYIRARFKKNDALSWRNALDNVLHDIQHAKHADALKDAVRKAVRETLNEVGDE